MRKIMITGGLGFIGSNLVRHWLKKYPQDYVMVLDSMTYAAKPQWALEVAITEHGSDRFMHLYCDIAEKQEVRKWMQMMRPHHIIHLAAESHVCRSIDGPKDFVHTNILGTFNMLEAFRELNNGGIFHHVSTDEVYGELVEGETEKFHELRRYAPRSPYAASKAASDHLVHAWHHTYGMNTITTNCSNNFGPNQHEEKLVPKAILAAIHNKPMTVYGSGRQVRDWLYVNDHCAAIDVAFHQGTPGHTYCIGGSMELTNLQMILKVEKVVGRVLDREVVINMKHTDDRPTDDLRYAVNSSKMESLGWSASPETFEGKLSQTVAWYAKRELGIE